METLYPKNISETLLYAAAFDIENLFLKGIRNSKDIQEILLFFKNNKVVKTLTLETRYLYNNTILKFYKIISEECPQFTRFECNTPDFNQVMHDMGFSSLLRDRRKTSKNMVIIMLIGRNYKGTILNRVPRLIFRYIFGFCEIVRPVDEKGVFNYVVKAQEGGKIFKKQKLY